MSRMEGTQADGLVQAFQLPADVKTTSQAAGTSAALTGGMYMLQATAACTIALGASCVTGMPLTANQPIFFGIPDGNTVTVAGVGTVHLTLMP